MSPDLVTVGIDISKRHLDVHLDPQGLTRQIENQPQAIEQLVRQLQQQPVARIVVESTGGYEKAVVRALAQAQLPVALVNPRPVRHYAKALGLLAKTDQIDAAVLASFARHVQTRVMQPVDQQQETLKQLVTRRRQIVQQMVAARNQFEHATVALVRESIQRTIAHLQTEQAAIETEIQQIIDACDRLKQRYKLLTQVQGVGPATARVLLTEMPELGQIHRKSLAALVGVAPMNNDSGQHRGKRTIRGGRSTVRRALYMATLVATRRNDVIREHYQQLLSRGKPKKVALVACMRKLLMHLNAIMRNAKND